MFLDRLHSDISTSIFKFLHIYDLYFLQQVSKLLNDNIKIYLKRRIILKSKNYSQLIDVLCEYVINNNYSRLLVRCIAMKFSMPLNDCSLSSFFHDLAYKICGVYKPGWRYDDNTILFSDYKMEYIKNKLSDNIIRRVWNSIPKLYKPYFTFHYSYVLSYKNSNKIIRFLLDIGIPYDAKSTYSICNHAVEYGYWDLYDLFYEKSTEYRARRQNQHRYHRVKNAYHKGHRDVIYELYKRNHPLPDWAQKLIADKTKYFQLL
jgi:hypothetical protein